MISKDIVKSTKTTKNIAQIMWRYSLIIALTLNWWVYLTNGGSNLSYSQSS